VNTQQAEQDSREPSFPNKINRKSKNPIVEHNPRFTMHRIPKLLLLLTFLILPNKTIADSKSVYDIASKSVFKITALDAFNQEIRYGFGVSIGKSECKDIETFISAYTNKFINTNKDGVDILTTFQNVCQASKIVLQSLDGKTNEVAIVYLDSLNNIAVIRSRNNINCVFPAISNEIKIGKKIYIYSFENSKSEVLRESFIDQIKSDDEEEVLIGISMIENKSKSGACAFDESGNLMGLYRGNNPLKLPHNSIIQITKNLVEKFKDCHRYNIEYPGCIDEKTWSVGRFYIPKYTGNAAESLKWKKSDFRWIQWENIENSINVLERFQQGNNFKNQKGLLTGSSPREIYKDSIALIYKERANMFPYDIGGRLNEILLIPSNQKTLYEIEKLREIYGNTYNLNAAFFENIYSLSTGKDIFNFDALLNQYLSKLPEFSESIPGLTKKQVLEFKSNIKFLSWFDTNKSKIKLETINSIVSKFEQLGWSEN